MTGGRVLWGGNAYGRRTGIGGQMGRESGELLSCYTPEIFHQSLSRMVQDMQL